MTTLNSILPTICISGVISVFGLAGIFVLFQLLKTYFLFKQSQHWSTTEGMVLFSGVDSQTSVEPEGSNTTYQAKVIYQYIVSGQTYEHNRIAFNSDLRTTNYNKQAELASRYPQGEPITVYYDPDDPEQAVLERKVSAVLLTLLMAAVFIGISILIALFTLGNNPPDGFLKLFGI